MSSTDPSSTDLTRARAYWVRPGLLAWPADASPAAHDRTATKWRLHASRDAGLTFDSERIHSDKSYDLRLKLKGLPKSVTDAYPYLNG